MKIVILAGGTGTRLWPLSRGAKPKQFHRFIGGLTMLQQTYARVGFLRKKDIFVATSKRYEMLVKDQLKDLPKENFIVEPSQRDTAPCICFAAHQLAKRGFGDEVMPIVYADHLIQKQDEFQKVLQSAVSYIEKTDALGVIAVRAKYPNPNLGYIHLGPLLKTGNGNFEVYGLDRFVEKPSMEKAKKFLLSYKYLWNTGLYLWKVKTILNKFKKLAPEIYKQTDFGGDFAKAPKISIDYAIMEKVAPGEVHVIPADLGWNDIGNWAALHEELARNSAENVSMGNNIHIDTEGCVIFGNDRKLIVTHGVKDMVIIDTQEALLVMPKEKAPDSKKIVEEIRRRKKGKYV